MTASWPSWAAIHTADAPVLGIVACTEAPARRVKRVFRFIVDHDRYGSDKGTSTGGRHLTTKTGTLVGGAG